MCMLFRFALVTRLFGRAPLVFHVACTTRSNYFALPRHTKTLRIWGPMDANTDIYVCGWTKGRTIVPPTSRGYKLVSPHQFDSIFVFTSNPEFQGSVDLKQPEWRKSTTATRPWTSRTPRRPVLRLRLPQALQGRWTMALTLTPHERRSSFASWIGISFLSSRCFICKFLPLYLYSLICDTCHRRSLLIINLSLSFLDRTNIGNAKLFNLQKDLNMPTTGPNAIQYNHALAVFFPFYVAAEIPSNMMMKRLRPSLWLTIIMM